MKKNTLFIADEPQDSKGGAALTFKALYEEGENTSYSYVKDLTKESFRDVDNVVMGNFFFVTPSQVQDLISWCEDKRVFSVEMDYAFCKYREPRLKRSYFMDFSEDVHSGREDRALYYSFLKEKAVKIFYMSEEQRLIHKKMLGIDEKKQFVISSCFSKEDWRILDGITSKPRTPNGKYCIVDGYESYQRMFKGTKEAAEFCIVNGIPYEVMPYERNHEKFLEIMSGYNGIVSMPVGWDSCPRLTLEARVLGLETIINKNVQNWREPYWRSDTKTLREYILGRPKIFWENINIE